MRTSSCHVASALRFDDMAAFGKRVRDLFPLPRCAGSENIDCGNDVLFLANTCLAALNSLERGGKFVQFAPNAPTKAQRNVHKHVAERCERMLKRLDAQDEFCSDIGLGIKRYEPGSQGPSLALVADRVDVPPVAATCDPEPLLCDELSKHWQEIGKIFPE